MSGFARATLMAMLIWLSVALPTLAKDNESVAGQLPESRWTYRWDEGAGNRTQIWRRLTSDVGGGWTPVGIIPGKVLDVAATASDPSLVVARTDQDIYRSRDVGETWQSLPDLPDWPTALALGQHSSGLIYLGTLTGGVFRSTDAGNTWQALSPDLGLMPGTFLETTALAVHPQDDEIVYAATGYWLGATEVEFAPVGIFASLDAGETWLPVHQSGLDEPMITALTPDAGNPLAVQAVTENGEHWYAFDNGALLEEWLIAGVPEQRAAAALAWGMVGDEQADRHLLARLVDESDSVVGQAIVRALSSIARPDMVPALSVAAHHPDPQIAWRAAQVLGSIPSPASVALLGEMVRAEGTLQRAAAAEALGQIGSAEAARQVVPLLEAPEMTTEYHLALSTLERIGEPAVTSLTASLSDPNSDLRRNAAQALGWIASPHAVGSLASLLTDADEEVRVGAAWALGQIDTNQARTALQTALNDSSDLVRAQAVGALGEEAPPVAGRTSWLPSLGFLQPLLEGGVWLVGLALMLIAISAVFWVTSCRGRQFLSPRHRTQ